jgi:hypothetical protein
LASVHPILFVSRIFLEGKYGSEDARKIWASAKTGSWIRNQNTAQYILFSQLFENAVNFLKWDYGNRVDAVRQQNLALQAGEAPKAFNVQKWRRDTKVFNEWERQVGTNLVLSFWNNNPPLENLVG